MNSVDTNAVLNRLLVIHKRSLPVYLSYAVPWSGGGDEAAADTLAQIANDHKQMADRLEEVILENGGIVERGGFPMAFTSLHFLAIGFLVNKLIEDQKRAIEEVGECVDQLSLSPATQAVAQEALGEAKGHLESLKELGTKASEA